MKNKIITLFLIPFLLGCQPTENSESIVIANVHVIDITNGTTSELTNIYISDDKVDSISTTQPTKDFIVVDGVGRYVLPGLIDSHVHTTAGSPETMLNLLEKTLMGGVTTVRDMGGDMIVVKNWTSDNTLNIPDIIYAAVLAGDSWMQNDRRARGSAHGGEPGNQPWLRTIHKNTSISAILDDAKAFGAKAIKLYADIPTETLREIVVEAKKRNLKVWSHATLYPASPQQVIDAKVDAISHAEILLYALKDDIPKSYHEARFLEQRYDSTDLNSEGFRAIIEKMVDNNVYLDATLFVTDLRAKQMGSAQDRVADVTYLATSIAFENGVKIVAGTDAMMNLDGDIPNLVFELELLKAKVGMSNLATIQSATIIPATMLGMEDRIGSVEAGKEASFILIDTNPLENLSALKRIDMVVKDGRIVKSITND